MIIRRMLADDAGKVAELEAANFSQPWKAKDFEKAAEDKDVLYLVAEEDENIIGCCGVRNLLGEGEITNVSVHASCRRKGIAENLLRRLLDEGMQMGMTDFTLEVRSSNLAAVRLYEKLGFNSKYLEMRFNKKE